MERGAEDVVESEGNVDLEANALNVSFRIGLYAMLAIYMHRGRSVKAPRSSRLLAQRHTQTTSRSPCVPHDPLHSTED